MNRNQKIFPQATQTTPTESVNSTSLPVHSTNPSSQKQAQKHSNILLPILFASTTVFFALATPEPCKAALLVGYNICVSQLLFALFPFLIAANLLVLCGVAPWIGRPLKPLCALLGFREPCVSGILVIALLGGFAPAITAMTQSVQSGQLSKTQASRLLSAICFLGPSYIIVAVGQGMLGNLRVGAYLFVSQVVASIICTLLLHIGAHLLNHGNHSIPHTSPSTCTNDHPVSHIVIEHPISVSLVIGESFFSFLRLCGVILYFQFLSAGVASFLPESAQWLCELFLEVTAACNSITSLGIHASTRCCMALSLLSGSILLQSVALCPKDVSPAPLFFSRLFHLPLALCVFRVCLLLPQSQTVYNSLCERVVPMQRLPLAQAILLFIALLFLVERLRKPLQRR